MAQIIKDASYHERLRNYYEVLLDIYKDRLLEFDSFNIYTLLRLIFSRDREAKRKLR